MRTIQMEMGLDHRVKRALRVSAGALSLVALGACSSVQDSLLEQQQPQIIIPSAVQNATGALGQYTGALGLLRTAVNGGNNNQEDIWNFEGLMTDEFKSGDTFSQRNDADQRQTSTNDGVLLPTYTAVQQARGFARLAINALTQFSPTSTSQIGEMYMEMGFMELTLGQAFCNGIPLGETVGGIPQYTQPLTNAAVFAQASARFDTALASITATDAYSVNVKNAAIVLKARTQVDLGNFAAAAALVAAVPTGMEYLITYSQTTTSNEWWQMGTNTKRYTVGDSVDATGIVANSLPFASANDPRVKVINHAPGKSFDNATPFVEFVNYGREDPTALVTGIDARLVEAEAKLQAADIPGMMTILNKLRTDGQKVGNLVIASMPALAAPATTSAATDLFFREKAFWQFGRGERLSDLRRLVRQYGRAQTAVYPNGPFHKGGNYGINVAFPVPQAAGNGSEDANPNFKGCLDLKA